MNKDRTMTANIVIALVPGYYLFGPAIANSAGVTKGFVRRKLSIRQWVYTVDSAQGRIQRSRAGVSYKKAVGIHVTIIGSKVEAICDMVSGKCGCNLLALWV